MRKIQGLAFSFWGVGTVVVYFVSLFVEKEAFERHFLFTKDTENLLQPFRAMLATADLANMVATASIMIVGGYFVQTLLGSAEAFKFWAVSLFAGFLSLWAFGPHTELYDWHLRPYFPFRCDGIVEGGLYAPDLMAASCLYMLLLLNDQKAFLAFWFAMDALYFGPLALAMPFSLIWFFKMRKNG